MLAWVAEGPVLAFLAYRFRYMPLRVLAFLVLVVGVGRLFGAHWPVHYGLLCRLPTRSPGAAGGAGGGGGVCPAIR